MSMFRLPLLPSIISPRFIWIYLYCTMIHGKNQLWFYLVFCVLKDQSRRPSTARISRMMSSRVRR